MWTSHAERRRPPTARADPSSDNHHDGRRFASIGKSLLCAWLAARITLGDLPGIHHGHHNPRLQPPAVRTTHPPRTAGNGCNRGDCGRRSVTPAPFQPGSVTPL
jgi:hypothetical protein